MLLSVNVRLARAFAVVSAASIAASSSAIAAAQTPAPPTPAQAKPAPKAAAKTPPRPKLPANVYARVGGQDITTQEVMQFLAELGGYPLVRQKVQVLVAERKAKQLGVTVTEAELDKAVAEQKNSIVMNSARQGTPMSFEEFGAKEGINAGLLRQQTRFQLLLRKSYAQSVGSLKDKFKVSHILISSSPLPTTPGEAPKPEAPGDAAKQDAEALVKVKQAQADIAAKKFKTFADAVTKYSDDPSKVQNNGDLGWISKDTQFVPEFLAAAVKLKNVGDISEPVKTQFGYHLIRLDAKGNDATPAERTAYLKQVEASADPQAIQAWFGEINSQAQITYNPQAKLNLPSAPAAAKKPVITSKRKS
ncbi:MAG: peptidylprolyl isomerase [Armatimonadota bacterium]